MGIVLTESDPETGALDWLRDQTHTIFDVPDDNITELTQSLIDD